MSTAARITLDDLLDEAPFVHALARTLAGRDAEEVVQGTWLRAMERDPGAILDPRRWLACVVRGVAHNLRRGSVRRQAREQVVARHDLAPSPADLLERQELRRCLLDAVDALPESQRSVVLLRHFEGLPPQRIAVHLGVPLTTVTSRLRSAHAALRRRLDERRGSRRAWIAALLPAPPTTPPPALPVPFGLGVLAMSIQGKVATAVGALLLAALALWAFAGAPPSLTPGPAGDASPPPLVAQGESDEQGHDADAPQRSAVVDMPPQAIPTTGTLVVKALLGSDRTPIPDLPVRACRPGADQRFGWLRARTDATGTARIAELAPGSFFVSNVRNPDVNGRAEIVPGEEAVVELVLQPGVTITGIVIDRFAAPVAGAEVCLAGIGAVQDAEQATTTGADGRFALPGCAEMCYVGARAAGHCSSEMQLVRMQDGSTRDLRLVLPAAGGTVTGTVFGPGHEPVADAVIAIGKRHWSRLDLLPDGALRALVRTDAEGRFRAVGIAAGEQPVQVRAPGLSSWIGTCRVEANVATPLDVMLAPAMACAGTVVDADGIPVAKAKVEVGDWNAFDHHQASTAADGTFHLDGLMPGDVDVHARHATAGSGTVTIHGGAGETVRCELRLSPGLVLRGRVLTQDGEPIADATVEARTADRQWGKWTVADAAGNFAILTCPEDARLVVKVTATGCRPTTIEDVDPHRGDFVVRVHAAPAPSAFLVGAIVAADGRTPAQAMVYALERRGETSSEVAADDAGTFAIGPLQPGTWRLRIEAIDQPTITTEWREIAADASLDLGRIWLPPAGTIRVRLHGADGLDPHVHVYDAALGNWSRFQGPGNERRSEALAAGPHYVEVTGDGIAARMVPVDVRVGEESELDVEVQHGCKQHFEFVSPAPITERSIRILQNGVLVTGSSTAGRQPGRQNQRFACSLAPGDYTITVAGDGMSGDAHFTVSDKKNASVRVVLR